MGDISKDFNRSEFACRCGCGFDTVDCETIVVVQKLRDYYNAKIRIDSGCRCEARNRIVGGERASKHMQGRACDVVVIGVHPFDVYAYLDNCYPDKYGIGKYNTFTHIDTRTIKARWQK